MNSIDKNPLKCLPKTWAKSPPEQKQKLTACNQRWFMAGMRKAKHRGNQGENLFLKLKYLQPNLPKMSVGSKHSPSVWSNLINLFSRSMEHGKCPKANVSQKSRNWTFSPVASSYKEVYLRNGCLNRFLEFLICKRQRNPALLTCLPVVS